METASLATRCFCMPADFLFLTIEVENGLNLYHLQRGILKTKSKLPTGSASSLMQLCWGYMCQHRFGIGNR